MKCLFGLPYYIYRIDPRSYDNDKIYKDILHNYSVDPQRNNWDNKSYMDSKLHHSNSDRENSKFKEINYTKLLRQYGMLFNNFMKELELVKQVNAEWTITNYTAMKSGQYMRKHNHVGDSDFTCVHYFKYNPEKHPSTTFYNPVSTASVIRYLRPVHYNNLNIKNPNHSWRLPYFQLDAKENEIHIMPSEVEHEVPPFESDELRITIVVNFAIK
jgi:hypothetical protein